MSEGGADASRLMRYLLLLRQCGITDPRVLAAMEKQPRSAYAPAAFAALALEDQPIPIGDDETSPRPSEAARILSTLDVGPQHRVLEVGSGSGFMTGVLSHLARRVIGLERRLSLVSHARACLGQQRIMNAHIHHADGLLGWREEAPFDRILLNGVAPPYTHRLFEDLAQGGLMLAPAGLPGSVRLRLFQKSDDQLVARLDLGPSSAKPLVAGVVNG